VGPGVGYSPGQQLAKGLNPRIVKKAAREARSVASYAVCISFFGWILRLRVVWADLLPRQRRYCAVHPPSIGIAVPVML
jgi:hypothetical protein